MNLSELVVEFERRRADAVRHNSTAPVAGVYGAVLEDLRRLDGVQVAGRFLSSKEAADILGVHPRTIARWCNAGRFARARKTSDDTGDWRIPAAEIYTEFGARHTPPSRPKLWTEDAVG